MYPIGYKRYGFFAAMKWRCVHPILAGSEKPVKDRVKDPFTDTWYLFCLATEVDKNSVLNRCEYHEWLPAER